MYNAALSIHKKSTLCRLSLFILSLIVGCSSFIVERILFIKFLNIGKSFFGLFLLSIFGIELIAIAILNILFLLDSYTFKLLKEKYHIIGLVLFLVSYIAVTIFLFRNKKISINIFLSILEVLLSVIVMAILFIAAFKCFGNIDDLLEISIISKKLINICLPFESYRLKYNYVVFQYNDLNFQIGQLGDKLGKECKFKSVYNLEYPKPTPIPEDFISCFHIFSCNCEGFFEGLYDIINKVDKYKLKLDKVKSDADNNMSFMQSVIKKKSPYLEQIERMYDNDKKIKSIVKDKRVMAELFDDSESLFDRLTINSGAERHIKSKIRKWHFFNK